MTAQIEFFLLGFAAVVDTVLLLVVLERINRPLTSIWVRSLIAGTWCWHVGNFLHVMLHDVTGRTAWIVDCGCMSVMAFGLLLLPCAMLHGGVRLCHTGPTPHPPIRRTYIAFYLPLLVSVAVSASIVRSGSRDFIEATDSFRHVYLVWLCTANLGAACLFLLQRKKLQANLPIARPFLNQFSFCLVLITALSVIYGLNVQNPVIEPRLRLLTALSPLLPTLLFAWYTFQQKLLPLVLERTVVYGAILVAVLLLHQVTLAPITDRLSRDWQLDVVVIEGLVLLGLVLCYQPLRLRVREGLRYLLSSHVLEFRDATRRLSVELSHRATADLHEIRSWFAEALRRALMVDFVWLSLSDADSGSVISPESAENDINPVRIRQLDFPERELWIDRTRSSNRHTVTILQEADAIAAFKVGFRETEVVLLLGRPVNADRLSDEQLNSVALLLDQFAVTLHNRQLDAARQTAERHAMQQEKLSVLGLLAGSLAHELKNPLSSMRTIATLLREDLGPDSESSREVQLIISEIDRLHDTTQRLLDYSRPSVATSSAVCPDAVIQRLMHILGHLGRQYGVDVEMQLHLNGATVPASDATLSEILFNLIKNALEAVRNCEQPRVVIATSATDVHVIVSVSDNGPGIEAEIQSRMFEPFVTSKADGTGLGLYLVADRVRELHGTICCESDSMAGSVFTVTLPRNGT